MGCVRLGGDGATGTGMGKAAASKHFLYGGTEILPATPQPWLLVLFIPVELVAFSLAKISAVLTAPGFFLRFSLLSPVSSLAVGIPVLHPKAQPGMCCKPTE